MFTRLSRLLPLILLGVLVAAPQPAAAQEDDLLEVTEAFRLSAEAAGPDAVTLAWDIAPDYYLYRGRVQVESRTAGVTLGELELPPGRQEHDEFLGDVETWRGQVQARQALLRDAGVTGPVTLAVQFQGCHEVDPKICYPPHTQLVEVELAPAPAPAADNAGGPGLLGALGQMSGASPIFGLGGDDGPGPPLPPEDAFHFEAIADDAHTLLARFTMPDGYYLYRDRSHVELAAGDGITLGTPEWSTGVMHTDDNFGTTEVFFAEADIRVPLQRDSGAATPLSLRAVFQGCQDGGICYPLMTREVTVDLPAADAAELAAAAAAFKPAAPPAQANALSEEQRLAGKLEGSGRWLALLLFFGAGLLLAFTPCVLPMVPILSGLIAGAGDNLSTRRAFTLSLVYVLATAVVFTAAGVVAGLVGANLQAAFQTPWVLWLFAAIFVLLALSMFGFYELQLPTALQSRLTRVTNRQKQGSLTGVAIMGVLSAFIVGPCVAPPLAAAVLYIAEQQDPVFGGVALFALALGMGVPLVIFGTAAGKLLPRAGAWMNAVKAAFGVVFLGLAIWMLSRILDPVWIMLMIGALLVSCAVYMGALERIAEGASGWRRLWKALGFIFLLVGAAQLVGALGGARDLLQPLAGLTPGGAPAAQGVSFRTIKTVDDLDRELAAASAAGQPVMLDFYADWCVSCKEMERFTYPKEEVQQALAPFMLLKVDVTANDAADQAMLKRFGLYGPPATIFFNAGEELRGLRLIGFERAGKFATRIRTAAGNGA